MPRLKCARRCRRVGVCLLAVLFIWLCCSVISRLFNIHSGPGKIRHDAIAHFLRENRVMVELQNSIVSRRIQSVIEREVANNRFMEDPPVRDIGRNIKQLGGYGIHRGLPNCPNDPPVTGPIAVNLTDVENITMAEVEKIHPDVEEGGLWRPGHCRPPHRLGIVIPYRDRLQHLNILLYYLLPVLKRQQLDFHIFVVEQVGNTTFNKGMLMNIGFLEAVRLESFDCFIFHDVDLILENDHNLYRCTKVPRHLSVGVDSLNYELPYYKLAGGVLNMPVEAFIAVNGYSNMFWGWGGEDDEMGERIDQVGLRIQRPPSHIAKYKMIVHKKSPADHYDGVFTLLNTVPKRILSDGLNSINYKFKGMKYKKLYTHIKADVGLPPEKGKVDSIDR